MLSGQAPALPSGQWNIRVRNNGDKQDATNTVTIPFLSIVYLSTTPNPPKSSVPFTIVLSGENLGDQPEITIGTWT